MDLMVESQSVNVDFFEGKHLMFKLNDRDYGIPILYINEIIGLMDITPMPKTPEFFKGVINLRGRIIPVVDMRAKFKMPSKVYDETTCIIIANLSFDKGKDDFVGLIVDMVSEVYNIPSSEIESGTQYGMSTSEKFLTGIGKVKDKVVMLLDIEAMINLDVIEKIMSKNVK